VILPLESTVIVGSEYDPAVTEVLASVSAPALVIVASPEIAVATAIFVDEPISI
jgi:hypothetical protein